MVANGLIRQTRSTPLSESQLFLQMTLAVKPRAKSFRRNQVEQLLNTKGELHYEQIATELSMNPSTLYNWLRNQELILRDCPWFVQKGTGVVCRRHQKHKMN